MTASGVDLVVLLFVCFFNLGLGGRGTVNRVEFEFLRIQSDLHLLIHFCLNCMSSAA